MSRLRDVERQSPVNHAFDILITDVDAVKEHHKNPDYKYRSADKIKSALHLLARQYNLQYKPDRRTKTPLSPLTGQKLFDLIKNKLSLTEPALAPFWKTGSEFDAIPLKTFNEIRQYSNYAQKAYSMIPHGFASVTWRHSEVEKMLLEFELSDASFMHPDSRDHNDSTRYSTPSQQPEDLSTSLPGPAVLGKRSEGQANPDWEAEDPNTEQSKDTTMVPPKPPKRRRTESKSGENLQPIDLSSTTGSDVQQTTMSTREDEFDINEVTNAMKRLSGELGTFVTQLFKHFHLQQDLAVVFDPKIKSNGLQQLYKACWGDEWRTVVKQNRKLLSASDVVQSLVSAYLHLHVFQSDDTHCIELAKSMEANAAYTLVKDVLRPTFRLNDQNVSSALSTMLLNGDIAQFQHYHNILMQQVPLYIINHEDTGKRACITFANELFDTLEPLISQLSRVAEACNPDEEFADWKTKLEIPAYQLMDQAFQVKRNAAPNSEYVFEYVWRQNGTPVDPDFMEAKAPSAVGVPVVVLTTLVPGLLYQQKGQKNWFTVQPAEILEKVQDDRSAQVQVHQGM
ncbi:hypothetical protein M409DRAFT_59739 [Zasmidium cellare ATCC 36951]|uniref:Uncharacterized protein n=1 Tax=Zasmidium cellare ATCC 36951 TaxID=1080233 RepID=A0A6A6C344_ZASCE|nr:uncharacterized protein M409DRAFT_59739 [Zasmidium cellare ATCC 36951]KAF2160708.1 hypothetical protein M409DRAFT_59739 [Zasmidium cellare ATCC 36951]